jgi:glycerol dehydrogenase
MSEHEVRIFAAAGTYLQGAGVLGDIGPHLARLGARAFGVVDPLVRGAVEPALAASCAEGKLEWRPEPFPGECTGGTVERLAEAARAWGADLVVAAGGGKALDTGKLMAEALRLPSVMVPTIASTDAPVSRIAVLYTEAHAMLRAVKLRASPGLVVADTAVIVRAPVRFLVAGMGDAIATWPEARTCAAGGGRTPAGGRPSRAALALAELCYRTVLQEGRQARADAAAGRVTPAVEAIVEANILLSGLGFESGGLAAAHALYAGLSVLPAGDAYLHGEKVAFGVVVQAVLEDWPDEERKALRAFYREVGLPSTLTEIGLGAASPADLEQAAAVACRPGSHMHNLARPISPEELVRTLERLRG